MSDYEKADGFIAIYKVLCEGNGTFPSHSPNLKYDPITIDHLRQSY